MLKPLTHMSFRYDTHLDKTALGFDSLGKEALKSNEPGLSRCRTFTLVLQGFSALIRFLTKSATSCSCGCGGIIDTARPQSKFVYFI